jgi:hypothetical protein
MAEQTEATRQPEILPTPHPYSAVEVNTYRTKSVHELSVDGIAGQWHWVKGGINPENTDYETSGGTIRYELLFNPETNTWLKIVSPKSYGTKTEETVVKRLKKSMVQQQMALEVAGLPHLRDQVKDVEVDIDGKTVYGYVAPHIGPSLESRIFSETGRRKSMNISPELSDFISQVYSTAADQAEKLYLDFGIWFSDPNPGNILLREEPDGIHVVLIDFSNKTQERSNIFTHITPGRYSSEKYMAVIKRMLGSTVKTLHRRFEFYCNSIGIPFIRDPQEIKQNIENSSAVLSAAKTMPVA